MKGIIPKQSAGSKLRRLAVDPDTELMPTRRGARCLADEVISLPDAQMALCNCKLVNSEHRHGQWRQTIIGQDAGSETIKLVVVVDTAFSKRIVILSGERLK